MKILIACEYSQVETSEFLKKGHDVYSCDILDCEGKFPERHIKRDVIEILNENWDMIITHPPCTYLSNVQTCLLCNNNERLKYTILAKEFFMKFYNNKCRYICIENPLPSPYAKLPKYDQLIQPYMFGEHYSKKTCLWLKNLPPLIPTFWESEYVSHHDSFSGSHKRSKSFTGIAQAMANQWG